MTNFFRKVVHRLSLHLYVTIQYCTANMYAENLTDCQQKTKESRAVSQEDRAMPQ